MLWGGCTLKFSGETVTPIWPRRLGSSAPSGTWSVKTCRSDEKKRNNSARARTSPRHILLPTPNGMKNSGLQILPSDVRKRSGLKISGSFHRFGSMCTAWIRGITWVPFGTVRPFRVVVLLEMRGIDGVLGWGFCFRRVLGSLFSGVSDVTLRCSVWCPVARQ